MGPIFSDWRIPTEEPATPALERKLRALSLLLALIFSLAGGSKLLGALSSVELFESLGLPWARQPVGLVELALAALLLGRASRPWAASGVVVLMICAATTHLITGVLLSMLYVDAVLLLSAAWLVAKQRPAFPQL